MQHNISSVNVCEDHPAKAWRMELYFNDGSCYPIRHFENKQVAIEETEYFARVSGLHMTVHGQPWEVPGR